MTLQQVLANKKYIARPILKVEKQITANPLEAVNESFGGIKWVSWHRSLEKAHQLLLLDLADIWQNYWRTRWNWQWYNEYL